MGPVTCALTPRCSRLKDERLGPRSAELGLRLGQSLVLDVSLKCHGGVVFFRLKKMNNERKHDPYDKKKVVTTLNVGADDTSHRRYAEFAAIEWKMDGESPAKSHTFLNMRHDRVFLFADIHEGQRTTITVRFLTHSELILRAEKSNSNHVNK